MVTYDFTLHLRVRDHTSWLWRCLRKAFGHILLRSHNFTVMALGSCVKWPLDSTSWFGQSTDPFGKSKHMVLLLKRKAAVMVVYLLWFRDNVLKLNKNTKSCTHVMETKTLLYSPHKKPTTMESYKLLTSNLKNLSFYGRSTLDILLRVTNSNCLAQYWL